MARATAALLAVGLTTFGLVGCRTQEPAARRVGTPIVVAPESPTPTVRTLPDTAPIEVTGQETKWRLWVTFVDRPRELQRLRISPTPEASPEKAEGQFVVVVANIENIGTSVPTVSLDLGRAVVLTDGTGKEYQPLRGASAAYSVTLPGSPGNPYEARLQPSRGIPYAFVFDVPVAATGLQFSGRGAASKINVP
jgi:hypothetical protein